MEGKSEAEQQALDAQGKGQAEAKKVADEAWDRAYKAYKEGKKQGDIVYKEAKKMAVDKQAKKEAGEAHKKAIEQAKKLRDAITAEAMVVFRCSYDKADADYLETQIKSRGAIKDADETYKESNKQAKKEANEAYKKAIEQAKQVRDEATRKLRQERNP
jgi:colicin import membrane protein